MTTTALEQAPNAIPALADRTLWQDARRRFLRNRLATAGLGVVGLFIIFAVFANVLSTSKRKGLSKIAVIGSEQFVK